MNSHQRCRIPAPFIRALLIAGIVLICAPVDAAHVTLNGYEFSDDPIAGLPGTQDSSDLTRNPYFSGFGSMADFGFNIYGYGSFSGYSIWQQYHFPFNVGGIQCSVIEEQGYVPYFSTNDSATSFTMEQCSTYYYYARDIENNIHLLQITISFFNTNISPISWSYEDLPAGGTTLIYPNSPVKGQQVFGGEVTDTRGYIGDVSNSALVIQFNSLPYSFPGTVKQYILAGSGMYASSYNWDGGTNGFSQNGRAPEQKEDSRSNLLERWRDKCFISVCED
jgi:hypothetical protein